jgi:hypothetical protein
MQRQLPFNGSSLRSFDIDVNFETIADLNPNDITIESYQEYTEKKLLLS